MEKPSKSKKEWTSKPRRKTTSEKREQYNKALGKYIKQKREEKGFTQNELAEKIYDGEFEAKGVSRIENGLYTPNIYVIKQIADVFDQSLSDFLEEFEYAKKKNKE